jgi:hypothetical protein
MGVLLLIFFISLHLGGKMENPSYSILNKKESGKPFSP